MPSLTETFTVAANSVRSIATIPLSQHMLYSVTLLHVGNVGTPVEAFGEIGIMEGGITYAHKIAVLDSGYVGTDASLIWTGNIIVLPETSVYAQLVADIQSEYRLSAILYKLIPLEDGGFRVDP